MNKNQSAGPFCQSCAMPMEKSEDFGTNADRSQNNEYCCYCYQNGKFTEPDTTREQMIEKVAVIMKQMQMPDSQIEQVEKFIPMLKRWQGQ
jgi:hypothetical protein